MTTPPLVDSTQRIAWPADTYQITVAGHLDDHWADWLGGRTLTRNDDASTTLTIAAVDQAQLHGVLGRIRDIGVNLLALHTIDDQPAGCATEEVTDGDGAITGSSKGINPQSTTFQNAQRTCQKLTGFGNGSASG